MTSRSREGAWIEISISALTTHAAASRSREGAWIEMPTLAAKQKIQLVAPVRERGLKSVLQKIYYPIPIVAPVRERGLKFCFLMIKNKSAMSLP